MDHGRRYPNENCSTDDVEGYSIELIDSDVISKEVRTERWYLGERFLMHRANSGSLIQSGACMMRDRDVRAELHLWLAETHKGETDTRILDELGLRHGVRRVDVAVVNGSLHGYEIKSDSDTVDRLRGQVEAYASVLDYATLVVGKKLITKAKRRIPKWWGLKVAVEDETGRTVLIDEREPSKNPNIDPIALAELLWRPEAVEILLSFGASPRLVRSPRAVLYNEIAVLLEVNELRNVVRSRLKMRTGWRDRKQLSLRDGSLRPIPRC